MQNLEELLEELLLELKIDLPKERRDRVIKDIQAWLYPSLQAKGRVLTEDGTFTLVSDEYGEPYHSVYAGALTECLEKFIKPSRVLDWAKNLQELRVLDVGFGLGYNLSVLIVQLREKYPNLRIKAISLEKRLQKDIPLLPGKYGEIQKLLLENLPSFEADGISWRLLLGDARESIKDLSGFGFHLVLHDPFSPYKNPELWSYHFLQKIKESMHEEGTWISYSASLPVRKALKELGFYLEGTNPVGRKKGGTLARLKGKDLLPDDELRKLDTSPYAVPFLDPDLKDSPLRILMRYRLHVEVRCLKMFPC